MASGSGVKPSLTLYALGVGRHNGQCPYRQHTSAHCTQSVTRSTATPVSPMSASSSSPSQPGQASRVENDQNFCAICADGLLWRERSTTLSCGHIFHPSCVEDLARHLRRRLFGGVISTNCPLCRGLISMSSISSFKHVRVIPTCDSSTFRRVHTTSSTSMAAFGYCYSSRRRYSSTRIASLYHSARLAAVRPRISSARSHGSRPSWRTHCL